MPSFIQNKTNTFYSQHGKNTGPLWIKRVIMNDSILMVTGCFHRPLYSKCSLYQFSLYSFMSSITFNKHLMNVEIKTKKIHNKRFYHTFVSKTLGLAYVITAKINKVLLIFLPGANKRLLVIVFHSKWHDVLASCLYWKLENQLQWPRVTMSNQLLPI